MKGFLISFGIFTLIIRVDSLIPLERTMPYGNTFPALILKSNIGLFGIEIKPAVPWKMKTKKYIEMLEFESFDKRVKMISNLSLSYKCPADENSLELEENDDGRCKNKLQVSVLANGNECGNDNRKEYDIGYGVGIKSSKYAGEQNQSPKKETVKHLLYTSCFDDNENKAYAAIYELRSRNELYQISNEIYPEIQQKMIFDLHSNFLLEMAKTMKPLQKNGSELIPFQLVSHEDMILYNWKLATFNKKNFSFIWNNVAENSWRNINEYLRKFMAECNHDLEVTSGVHDYTREGYPRYIWKYIRKGTKGMAVVIHNQHKNDKLDYPKLCLEPDNNCDGYSFWPNETFKDNGYSYCCVTKNLQDHKVLFFENKFSKFEKLVLADLRSVDNEYHPPAYDLVTSETVRSSSRHSSPALKFLSSSSKSSSPTSKTPSPSSTPDIHQQKAMPKERRISKPSTPISNPLPPAPPKFNQSTDPEVVKVQNSIAKWKISTSSAPEKSKV